MSGPTSIFLSKNLVTIQLLYLRCKRSFLTLFKENSEFSSTATSSTSSALFSSTWIQPTQLICWKQLNFLKAAFLLLTKVEDTFTQKYYVLVVYAPFDVAFNLENEFRFFFSWPTIACFSLETKCRMYSHLHYPLASFSWWIFSVPYFVSCCTKFLTLSACAIYINCFRRNKRNICESDKESVGRRRWNV